MAEDKCTDYRKHYEECTGEKVKKNYHVHHIDHNRKNNKIKNLVAIPIKLHSKYHNVYIKYLEVLESIKDFYYFYSTEEIKYCKLIKNYMDIKTELYKYISIRNSLIIDNNNIKND